MTLVVGLAVINASGVSAQLVAAHIGDRGSAQSAIETQDAELAARIESQAHMVADLDARVSQIDAAVAEQPDPAAPMLHFRRSIKTQMNDSREIETRKLAFCLRGEIDKTTLHKKPRKKFAEDGRLKAYGSGGRKPPTISPTPSVYSLPSLSADHSPTS